MVGFMHHFEKTAASEDFTQLVEMIHPDAVFRFTDGDFCGLEAVREAFEKTWSFDTQDERYYLSDINVLCTDSQSASATYTYNWEGKADGRQFSIRGRCTRVVLLDAGKMKIIHEHLSRLPR